MDTEYYETFNRDNVTLVDLRRAPIETVTPHGLRTAEDARVRHINEVADQTLFPRANSWCVGANIPGKPRVFMPYVGGLHTCRHKGDEVAAGGDAGFELASPGEEPSDQPFIAVSKMTPIALDLDPRAHDPRAHVKDSSS